MSALLSALGLKDAIYGVLIVAALAWGGWTWHKYESAVAYAATVKTESSQAKAAAAKQVADLTAQHTAAVAAIQEKQNADLQAAAAQSAGLAQRLRQYAATRCTDTVLPGAPAPASIAAASPSSIVDAVAGLVSAAAHDNAVIAAERAERDALTGK